MAKESDKNAGALGAEKTGGMLSGLLADENEFDRRALWRIGWWGAAAVGAVVVAVLANQTAQGWRRDRISAADLSRQAQLLQSLARETQSESRQLAAAIETLNTDRDRLYARLTVLEQGLDSVTGALAKQNSAPASASSAGTGKSSMAPLQATADAQASATPGSPSPSPSSTPVAAAPASNAAAGATASQASNPPISGSSAAASPPVGPVTTTMAAVTDKPHPEPAKPAPTPAPLASSVPTQAPSAPGSVPSSSPVANTPPASPATAAAMASLVTPRSVMAPPDPAATRLTEPDKLAKADIKADIKPDTKADIGPQPDATTAKSGATAATVQRTEFAVDLGGANSISGLRALWRGLAKNSDLAALHPIIILKEGNTGLGMQLRLGAGPLSDAAAAAKICARLAESQRPCETTVYDGQRLAVRGDDAESPAAAAQPAPAAKPAAPPTFQRRRGGTSFQQRHGAREEPPAPPAPPAPEPSTLSSLLFRRQ